MELYIFRHDVWTKLYSCDYLTQEEWRSHSVPRVFSGTFSICLATVTIALYVACIVTMRRKEFFRNSCYKIMFYLGLVDITSQTIDGLINGYFLLVGIEFCTLPDFNYIAGAVAFATWSAQCVLCLLLAFNRLCDITGKKQVEFLFSGYRTHIWCSLALLYGFAMWLFPPAVVFQSSAGGGWYFDPYTGYDNLNFTGIDRSSYFTQWMLFDNIEVSVMLVILYSLMLIKLYLKTRIGGQSTTSFQKSIFWQAALVCLLSAVPATIYLYMQFFYTPEWVITVAHFGWQGSNGAPAFVYLIFNRSIRRHVLRMLGLKAVTGMIMIF
ncbi:hypothetical protein QR680_016333 [Steinernema hermaphroditum]|uniref:Uncharacterized protein n=1 Tax=Steinernema hermaphroditum TaxID=289476 RepID=A0AA39LMH4_9BILA|nr:hypothetical protein QR680_016333 [Steinernema hermaphroditum]